MDNGLVHSKSGKPVALVYGKEAYMWEKALNYLVVLSEFFEVHANVLDVALAPEFSFVIQHNCSYGAKFNALLRSAKVFVGLGFPYEGPAPLEAIANGVIFLNPVFKTPHSRNNTKFFADKPTSREVSQHRKRCCVVSCLCAACLRLFTLRLCWRCCISAFAVPDLLLHHQHQNRSAEYCELTSQQPYLERYVGEPYTYLIETDNPDQIRQTVRRLMSQKKKLHTEIQQQTMLFEHILGGTIVRSCADTCIEISPQIRSQTNSTYLNKRLLDVPSPSNPYTVSAPLMFCAPEHFTSVNHYRVLESLLPDDIRCNRIESVSNPAAPYWDPTTRSCVFQADRLLFDCTARLADAQMQRICPCQVGLPGQVALCVDCV
ncbi:unnamed protein product [Echinostoma caproni]|uniref:alpha-1,6-mannosyl-glycoprotein 6-beta-N-acetylglucosaminyltransferase n=1 Tax=Echinostoma caproni TaxID=27848 RepID=A0A183A5F4_9TREM|nr:unnamed protein product [Echinostoma caproni]